MIEKLPTFQKDNNEVEYYNREKINEIIEWINKFESLPDDVKEHEEIHKSNSDRFILKEDLLEWIKENKGEIEFIYIPDLIEHFNLNK